MGQDEEVIRPDAVGRAVREQQRDLAGGQHRAPARGQVEGELVLALDPPIGGLGQEIGARVGRREPGGRDQGVERRPGRGVAGVLDVEDEAVKLPVGDDPDGDLVPEASRIGMKFPDRLQPLSPPVVDDPIGRQLAARSAMLPGVGIDPGAIVLQTLGRQSQLAGRDPRPIRIVLGNDRDEDPVVLLTHRQWPALGIWVVTPVLGCHERLGGLKIDRGVRAAPVQS